MCCAIVLTAAAAAAAAACCDPIDFPHCRLREVVPQLAAKLAAATTAAALSTTSRAPDPDPLAEQQVGWGGVGWVSWHCI